MTKQTALNKAHRKLNAKMIEFGGWDMPVDYGSLIAEHEWVRSKCGVFDVSHMGEFFISGNDSLAFLQELTCNDVGKLAVGQVQYNALIHPEGGVVDDVTLYRRGESSWMLCVNASNIDKDWQFASDCAKRFKDLKLENKSDDFSLLAIQGPEAESVVSRLWPNYKDAAGSMGYYRFVELDGGILSRTGYSGEDGFEWYLPNDQVQQVWDTLMADSSVKPVGLGARDTLRLEARYPLYGHELDDVHTIVEGGQGWIVKEKSPAPACQPKLLEQKKSGPEQKVSGFILLDPGIARQDCSVEDGQGNKIGTVTSGSFSPSLKKAIGLARIKTSFIQEGQEIVIDVRGQKKKAQVKTGAFLQLGAGKKGKS